jgi:hypothetical protein
MKILFFLLALANVMLVMWEYHKGSFSPSAHASIDNFTEYQEQIVLLSELGGNTLIASQIDIAPMLQDDHPVDIADKTQVDEKPRKDEFLTEALTDLNLPIPETSNLETAHSESENLSTGSVGTKSVDCLEAGPFANEEVYKIWEKRLNGFIQGISRDEPAVKDYLVYYPAGESMLLSKTNLKMLQDKGIKDFWMFTQGEEQGQISLGVFNRSEKALILKNELLAQGIYAEIRARYKTKIQKFAVIRRESSVIENLELLKKAYPKVIVNQTAVSGTENCF